MARIFWLQIALLLGISNLGSAQVVSNYAAELPSFQYGFSAKLNFEVQRFANFRLSLVAGAGKRFNEIEFLQPTIHTEVQLYRGGMGSSLSVFQQRKLNIDYIVSFLMIGGIKERKSIDLEKRFNPINFFNDNSATPLQNQFYHSFSLGTNYIFFSDSFKKAQYIGFLNFNIQRTYQFSYYNDGTPFHFIGLGDGYDRYFTGGGFFAYYGELSDDINLIEFSFNKFTGYQQDAFELANHLQIDFLPYKDYRNYYYNQSRFRLKIGSNKHGFSAMFSGYDIQTRDGQDLIHYLIHSAYHPNPDRNWRPAIGISYNYINEQF